LVVYTSSQVEYSGHVEIKKWALKSIKIKMVNCAVKLEGMKYYEIVK
jgi:hypothetical protein